MPFGGAKACPHRGILFLCGLTTKHLRALRETQWIRWQAEFPCMWLSAWKEAFVAEPRVQSSLDAEGLASSQYWSQM